jgi:hypothetical protein
MIKSGFGFVDRTFGRAIEAGVCELSLPSRTLKSRLNHDRIPGAGSTGAASRARAA